MTWEMMASMTAFSGLLGVAVWRFSRMESAVRHNSQCQKTLVKMIGRLNYRVRQIETGSR